MANKYAGTQTELNLAAAFSGIFILGYLVIWAIIYFIIRHNTAKVNEMLKEKQQGAGKTHP